MKSIAYSIITGFAIIGSVYAGVHGKTDAAIGLCAWATMFAIATFLSAPGGEVKGE